MRRHPGKVSICPRSHNLMRGRGRIWSRVVLSVRPRSVPRLHQLTSSRIPSEPRARWHPAHPGGNARRPAPAAPGELPGTRRTANAESARSARPGRAPWRSRRTCSWAASARPGTWARLRALRACPRELRRGRLAAGSRPGAAWWESQPSGGGGQSSPCQWDVPLEIGPPGLFSPPGEEL